MLAKLLGQSWWVLLLRGVLAILLGIAAFARPGMALKTLLMLFAAYVFIDGISNVIAAFSGRDDNEHWWVVLIEGILGIAIGVLTVFRPGTTGVVLLVLIAFWAIMTGILRIILAIRLRKEIEGEWWLGLSGLLGVLFGVIVMMKPGAGALSVLWMIGFWLILMGITLVLLSFKSRGFHKKLDEVKDKVKAAVT
ncbi:MAG: HdeD family acid-resistance protein [Acidobacteria bacterium]|jgi:uncharacterized membrane protein HdeD (DUF308 family)|nr:HdeD family acid-resistance protein [Acidobacteriota bacterium]